MFLDGKLKFNYCLLSLFIISSPQEKVVMKMDYVNGSNVIVQSKYSLETKEN